MTISEQIKKVKSALAKWAEQNNGAAQIANDQAHLIDMFRSNKPGGLVAAILWDTEDPRGENDELGMVDRGFKVVLSRGRGFRLETGESLTDGVAGGRPMFDLVEEAREAIRSLRFDSDETERIPVYRGSGPYEVQGYALDAVEIRFGIGSKIPTQE